MLSKPQATTRTIFPRFELFRDRESAYRDLERVRERVPQGLLSALLGMLADSPDPDQALNLFERLISRGDNEMLALLDRNHVLLHYVIMIFGHSFWLGETVLHNTDVLHELARERRLELSSEKESYRRRLEEFRASSPRRGAALALARFKKREYVRIALRDTLGIATLGETTAEISVLADVLIEEALREARLQLGSGINDPEFSRAEEPISGFAVLAMGKLGGNELNYSSDADLLYIYDAEASAEMGHGREYFIHLAQELTGILSQAIDEGAVFRIDLRLRPEGNEGEAAVALHHALDYYMRVAHDWELQALIKARYVAGDIAVARSFIRGVHKFVYKESLNLAAIETAIRSRQRMDARRRRSMRGESPDLKLDRGGIRDIEFMVQCLQRVYGGSEPWLRSGGTLASLQKLHDKEHLDAGDFHQLSVSYIFLRKLEHRLQLQRGRQVHQLPTSDADLEVLSRALGDERIKGPLLPAVQSCMLRVAGIYERAVRSAKDEENRRSFKANTEAKGAGRPPLEQLLARAGIDSLDLSDHGLSRHTRRGLERYLGSAMSDVETSAQLVENPGPLRQVLPLLQASEYLTEILVRHPEALFALREHPGVWDKQPALSAMPLSTDLNETMALLRREFRSRMFLAGARDVMAPRPVLDSMRETSRLADEAISCALRAVDGEDAVAVFALGRLGTNEFDIASDADLLFVRDPAVDAEQARSVAEKLVHVLAAYTREGTVFAVDARLRPHGGEGELVVTPAQVETYLTAEAQSWEALTYSKMRFVAGREEFAAQLPARVRERIVELGVQPGFEHEVLAMRARLEKSNRYAHSFKLARGGFYDIDFIASFLMLSKASMGAGNTLERLEHLRRQGILPQPLFEELSGATMLYRTTDHVIRLVTGRARPELPEAEHARQATEALANKTLGRESSSDLQTHLEETQRKIRDIFLEIIHD